MSLFKDMSMKRNLWGKKRIMLKHINLLVRFIIITWQEFKFWLGFLLVFLAPFQAAVYFNKIQCFCFEEQRLLPGEQIDMPVSGVFLFKLNKCFKGKTICDHWLSCTLLQVFFYIDPEFETDPRMDGINNLILSYTFFKVSEE